MDCLKHFKTWWVLLVVSQTCVFSQVNINNVRFKQLMSDSNNIVLDVRTPEEFAEGFIAGIAHTVNVNFFASDFLTRVEDQIRKDQKVLVYCAAGGRSSMACKALKKAGYKKVYELDGGYNGWEE